MTRQILVHQYKTHLTFLVLWSDLVEKQQTCANTIHNTLLPLKTYDKWHITLSVDNFHINENTYKYIHSALR